MRKIVLNLAISLDGYISDNDGGFEWIVGHGDKSLDTSGEDEFKIFLDSVDTVVMGSLAYEDCVMTGLSSFDDKEIIVATSRDLEGRDNVRFVSENICDEILKLREKPGKDIYLFGGAGLVECFIKADIIDRYIIGVIPTILGDGRLLFKGGHPQINLHLDGVSISDGVTVLTYSRR